MDISEYSEEVQQVLLQKQREQEIYDLHREGVPLPDLAARFTMAEHDVRAIVDATAERDRLVDKILEEMERVWGPDINFGSEEDYQWLAQNYGISEDDDYFWVFVLNLYNMDETNTKMLAGAIEADDDVSEFIADNAAINAFLTGLLKNYTSNRVSRIQTTS